MPLTKFRQLHSCVVSNVGPVNLTSGTTLYVPMPTELYDPFNLHSTTVNTSRIVISKPGNYLVGGHGQFQPNATGNRQLAVYKNTTGLETIIDITGSVAWLCVSGLVPELDVGDFLELRAFQNSGSTLTFSNSRFWISEVI